MRKLLPLIIFCACMLSSCSISTSDNGKLDGFWHLVGIDTLQEGHATIDLSQERRYWAVQGKLLNVRDMDHDNLGFWFRFNHEGDSLTLSEPFINGFHEDTGSGDTPLTNPAPLYKYGITQLEEHFYVEQLTSSDMVLRSRRLKLYFKKM